MTLLRQTTVCMARFSRRSNSITGEASSCPTKYGSDRAVEIQAAALQQAERRAGEQIEVGRERAVGQVVDDLEAGLLTSAQQACRDRRGRCAAAPAARASDRRTTGRCGCRAAALRSISVPPGFSTRRAVCQAAQRIVVVLEEVPHRDEVEPARRRAALRRTGRSGTRRPSSDGADDRSLKSTPAA